jgi:hypothetical protein
LLTVLHAIPKKSVPAVTETLDPLHKLESWILWRGQQRVIPKVSVYFVIDSVWKLLDTPS